VAETLNGSNVRDPRASGSRDFPVKPPSVEQSRSERGMAVVG